MIKLLVNVEGQAVDVGAQLSISVDIGQDLSNVSAQIGYWGAQAAAAQSVVDKLESDYTVWKATTSEKILQADPKLSEWKATTLRESLPEYKQLKDAIADAQKNANVMWAIYNGFRAKVSALQSRGAMMREELSAMGQTVKAGVDSPKRQKP